MLAIKNLSKTFYGQPVLDNISLSIGAGEVVGLIGRSGAGKSTLARCLTGLETAESGKVFLDHHAVVPGQGCGRQHIQYLWQDPRQSLSPYLTAENAVLETLNGFKIGPVATRRDRAQQLLASLDLTMDVCARRPHALSGGQCQRVALARALSAEPKMLILDEPLSSLDVTAQLGTIRLLQRVHAERGTSMLVVSHDFAPLRRLADRILVLDKAQIAEDLRIADFAEQARNPLSVAYAQTLTT
ncbi:MAG: dipeptide/oligopeptide/nickel ABC transporter ATP-binding protein [Roseobacter sp.]